MHRRITSFTTLMAVAVLLVVILGFFNLPLAHAEGTFIPAPNRVDMVYDAARDVVYITNGDSVLRYHLGSSTFLTPLVLGGSLRGIDISPNGNTIAVADGLRTDTNVWIHLIDLTNGHSKKVLFPRDFSEGGTFSVAYGSDGAILVSSTFEGSGWVPLRRYDPIHATTTTLASIRQDSMLTASADRSMIAYEESNISDGRWGTYAVATGIVTSRAWYENGTSWFNYEIGVNRNGTQYAIPTYGGTYIYDSAYTHTATVGQYAGEQPIGLVYHPTQDIVYFAWAGTSEVRAHDTNTFAQVASYNVEQTFNGNGNYAFTQGRLKIAHDGSLLFVTVNGGVRCIWLTRTAPTGTPTNTPTKTPVPSTKTPLTPTSTPMNTPTATPQRTLADYAVTINAGALYTKNVSVTLTLIAPADTSEMQISNDGGFAQAHWEPYQPTREWQLTRYLNYAIPHTIYVRFKDSAGAIWGTFQDDILLDQTPPHGHGQFQPGNTAGSQVVLALEAIDDVSGVGAMRLSSRADFEGALWEPYQTSRLWDFGSHETVYIQFRDNATNISPITAIQQWRAYLPFLQ